ncbi:hypothetical protein [Shewanella xiamenensis]|uniref:hypothetical protein n=1 Tax=Shewanella xiamenensis TaxID=332186 RepID=UPI00166B79E1|nr:hypothetical protein [Shewanella xiamenensis]MCL1072218.1 hypothetical protein [Shewanella xiamenensis]MCR4535736.1 hypothetical protein [Shewanella xiamenensis]MEE1981577.1 hypothetical protein [Shewanella xiamenensis]WHF55273.1 hypothetical protein OCF84_18140 [Shewanella xiamenensis]GGN00259.1 hypothetical protein GCM10009124_32110 [Shewanella xiamenensis]
MKLFIVISLSTALFLGLWSNHAFAGRWEVRNEYREGKHEIEREKREAKRELKRCKTRECAKREIREGYSEVSREKREARREIRRELRDSRRERWDDDSEILGGVVVGAAIIGIASAIANDD